MLLAGQLKGGKDFPHAQYLDEIYDHLAARLCDVAEKQTPPRKYVPPSTTFHAAFLMQDSFWSASPNLLDMSMACQLQASGGDSRHAWEWQDNSSSPHNRQRQQAVESTPWVQ